jgi:hypothetical protein
VSPEDPAPGVRAHDIQSSPGGDAAGDTRALLSAPFGGCGCSLTSKSSTIASGNFSASWRRGCAAQSAAEKTAEVVAVAKPRPCGIAKNPHQLRLR